MRDERTDKLVELYTEKPDIFNTRQQQYLNKYIADNKINELDPRAIPDNDFHVTNMLRQLVEGYISGFSTLRIGTEPRNDVEMITRAIGELGGFVGFVPGASIAAKLGSPRVANVLKKLQGQSIPMIAANAATKKATEYFAPLAAKYAGNSGAFAKSMAFLNKPAVSDVVRGATHLGIASAVSSWQDGVDGVMTGFTMGAFGGAMMRGIANMVNVGNPMGDKMLRALSNSVVMGLPSTLQGATAPMQVYQYLLGGYFGLRDMPYFHRLGSEYVTYANNKKISRDSLHLMPEFKNLDEKTQQWVKKYQDENELKRGQTNEAIYTLVKGMGSDLESRFKEIGKSNMDDIYTSDIKDLMFNPDDHPILREVFDSALAAKKNVSVNLDFNEKDPLKSRFVVDTNIEEGYVRVQKTTMNNIDGEASGEINKSFDDAGRPMLPSATIFKLIELSHNEDAFSGSDPITAKVKRALEIKDTFELLKTEFKSKHEGKEYTEDYRTPTEEFMSWFTTENRELLLLDDSQTYLKRNNDVEKVVKNYLFRSMNMRPEVKKIPEISFNKDGTYGIVFEEPKAGRDSNDIRVQNISAKTEVEIASDELHDIFANPEFIDNKKPNSFFIKNIVIRDPDKQLNPAGKTIMSTELNGVGNFIKDGNKYVNPQDVKAKLVKHAIEDGYAVLGGTKSENMVMFIKDLTKVDPVLFARTEELFDKYIKGISIGSDKLYSHATEIINRRKLDEDISEWVKKGYGSREDYIRSFLNNILHHVHINKGSSKNYDIDVMTAAQMLNDNKFVKTANEYNKRSQTQINTAAALDVKDFFRHADLHKHEYMRTSNIVDKDGNVKFVIVEDKKFMDKIKVPPLKINGVWTDPEVWLGSTDGAAPTLPEFLQAQNVAMGNDRHLGFGKNMIYSREPNKGAFMFKGGFHSATDDLANYMAESGIAHVMMQETAKQIGYRSKLSYDEFMDYYNSGTPIPDEFKHTYNMKDSRVLYGIKTDIRELNHGAKIPRPVFNIISPYIMQFTKTGDVNDLIKNVKDATAGMSWFVEEQVRGVDEFNRRVESLVNISDKWQRRLLIKNIINNIDSVGKIQLAKALKEKGNADLLTEFANHIKNVNIEDEQESMYDTSDYADNESEGVDIGTTVTDRMLDITGDARVVSLHKFGNPVMNTTIKNWFVDKITRPHIENSINTFTDGFSVDLHDRGMFKSSRVRKGIVEGTYDYSHLDTSENPINPDDLFYGGNGLKKLEVKTDIGNPKNGKSTLGKMWKDYMDKLDKDRSNPIIKEYDEFFRTFIIRIPADSTSGGQVLRFAGFNGRDNLGLTVHPLTALKLGTADYDGDKLFAFFGNRRQTVNEETGEIEFTGKGFAKEWKDAFYLAKNESHSNGKFKFPGDDDELDAEYASDNSQKISQYDSARSIYDLLGVRKFSGNYSQLSDKMLMMSPNARLKASETAVNGRGVLGSAVVLQYNINAGITLLMGHNANGKRWTDFEYNGKKYRVALDVKGVDISEQIDPSSEAYRKYIKEVMSKTQTAIGIGSDPMDIEFMPARDEFIKNILDGVFKTEVYKDGKWSESTDKKEQNAFIELLKKGYNKVYGRNSSENKAWESWEIKAELANFNQDMFRDQGSHIVKTYNLINDIDYGYNIAEMVDLTKFEDLLHRYDNHIKLSNPEMAEFFSQIGRTTLSVPHNETMKELISFIDKNGLTNFQSINEFADRADSLDILKASFTENHNEEISKTIGIKTYTNRDGEALYGDLTKGIERKKLIYDIIKRASDMISNDVSAMSSATRLFEIYKSLPMKQRGYVDQITNEVMLIKLAYNYNRYKDGDKMFNIFNVDGELPNNAFVANLKKEIDSIIEEGVDQHIKAFKNDVISHNDKDGKLSLFFDTAIVGDMFFSSPEYLKYNETSPERAFFKYLAENTTQLRLGISSPMVGNNAIRGILENYKKMINSITVNNEAAKEIDEVMDSVYVDETTKKRSILAKNVELANQYLQKEFSKELKMAIASEMQFSRDLKERTKLSKEGYAEVNKLVDYLKRYNVGPDKLNGFIAHLTSLDTNIGKNIADIDMFDIKTMNSWFDEISKPGIMVKLFSSKEDIDKPIIRKVYSYMFPSAVARDMMRFGFDLVKEDGIVETKYGLTKGSVYKPSLEINNLSNIIQFASEQATIDTEKENAKDSSDFEPFLKHKDGEYLFDYAVSMMEKDGFVNGKLSVDKKLGGTYSEQLAGYTNKVIRAKGKLEYLGWKFGHKQNFTIPKTLIDEYGLIDMVMKADPTYHGQDTANLELSKTDVQLMIRKIIAKKNMDKFYIISGEKEEFEKLLSSTIANGEKRYLDKLGNPSDKGSYYNINTRDLLNYFEKIKNTDISVFKKIGLDNMQNIAKSMLIQMSKRMKNTKLAEKLASTNPSMTGQIPFEFYWPHVYIDRAKTEEALIARVEKAYKTNGKSQEDKKRDIKNILYYFNKTQDEYMFNGSTPDTNDFVNGVVRDIISERDGNKLDKEHVRWIALNQQFGHQFSRSTGSLGNYLKSQEAMQHYTKGLYSNLYKQLAQIMSRLNMEKFMSESKLDYDVRRSWYKFFELYVQGAMGYPVVVPESYKKDKAMNLDYTLYSLFSDNNVKNKINSVFKAVGIKREITERDLMIFSNLEAKFQLATLLSRPKTMIANVLGGTINTVIDTGAINLLKANNITELRKINPNFITMKDVHRFVIENGVIEDFIVNEAGYTGKMSDEKFKLFIESAVSIMKKDIDVSDKTLLSIAKEYGISDSVFNAASFFMRKSERFNRINAFVSSYIHVFNEFGGRLNYDDPLIIELAKKSMRATQFMYSNSFRPMFSTSAVGKVMTRFQTWAYNSVGFMNNIMRNAKIQGYNPNSKEIDKLKRWYTINMFSLAMASAFIYSIFDSNLAPPFSWLQDFALWMFGTDEEREKAFFGSYPGVLAPAQLVSPPFLRMVAPTINAVVSGDWTKMADYYVWTMFPFGTVMNDVRKATQRPGSAIEKLTGFPYKQATQMVDKVNKKQMGRYVPFAYMHNSDLPTN